MTSRSQRNTDKIQAIIELLAEEEIIEKYEAQKLKSRTEHNECTELANGFCERR